MASSWDDSKIVKPLPITLLHLAYVRVAFDFFNEFDCHVLDELEGKLEEIKKMDNTPTKMTGKKKRRKEIDEHRQLGRATEWLLFIPEHLRKMVIETIRSLHLEAENWRVEHIDDVSLEIQGCCTTLRSEGTVDRTLSAYNLVTNRSIGIRERFDIACLFCLENDIQDLWAEMEADGETVNFKAGDNTLVRFWVRWIREGSRVPWIQAAQEYLDPPLPDRSPIPRFSNFLPFLTPQHRKRFLPSLKYATFDDLRFCLYALTKEEETEIVENNVDALLSLYLDWPLQNQFLEIAEKVWNYVDNHTFNFILDRITFKRNERKNLNYSEIYDAFWNRRHDYSN